MARPFKIGLEYFPLDVYLLKDDKILKLRYRFGPLGVYIYIHILTMIYEKGYYLKIDYQTLIETLHMEIGQMWINCNKLSEIVECCIKIGLFEEALVSQSVITSVAIQKQYIESTRRRKEIDISLYWLIDDETLKSMGVTKSTSTKGVITGKNYINEDNNVVNDDNSTQSKRKRKSDKKDKEEKRDFALFDTHYITKCIIKNSYTDIYDLDIPKYNDLFVDMINIYGFDNTRRVVNYIVGYSKRTSIPIDFKFAFMRGSLKKNLENLEMKEQRKDEPFEKYIKRIFLPVDQGD
jgi:hypothetical protein